jgi:hypothetical protein
MTITLRRHRDGTFSLTGLSRADVDNLAHGMNDSAAVLYGMDPAKLDNDHEYIARTGAKYERLALVLRRLASVTDRGLYTSTYRAEITGDNSYGDPEHVAYEQAPYPAPGDPSYR